MSLARIARWLGISCLVGAGALAPAPEASAWFGIFGCCHEKCPPYYIHCQEGPPKIKIKCGCPKPVCDPCTLPHFGYFRTCWQPWPFPPDWSHCPVPPPAVALAPHLMAPPGPGGPDQPPAQLPPPRPSGDQAPKKGTGAVSFPQPRTE
jgi:hypothetical protein